MSSAPAEYLDSRRRSLARMLQAESLDALLVSQPQNIAYLTGFFGSAGVLVATSTRLILLSDSRYEGVLTALAEQLPELTAVVAPSSGSQEESLVAEIARLAPDRLGIEAAAMTVRHHLDLSRRLEAAGIALELVPVDGAVERLREVKDAWEVATLREAGQRLSDVAKCIIPKALAGLRERDVAAIIEWELRRKGFDKPAFDTIVASGPNAAMPHHRAGDRQMSDGDLVVIGFRRDVPRVCGGHDPDGDSRRVVATAADLLDAVARGAASGVRGSDDRPAGRRRGRRGEASAGAGRFRGSVRARYWVTGSDLEVHERPRLSRRRPGASRGPAAGRAWCSRSSPASTFRVGAVCESRTTSL